MCFEMNASELSQSFHDNLLCISVVKSVTRVRFHQVTLRVARNANINVTHACVTTTSSDIICINTITDITDIKIFINITDVNSNKTEPSRWNRVFRH
jgi:hypothetical protein